MDKDVRIKDRLADHIYTIVNEQRMLTGEFRHTDAENYASIILDDLNMIFRGAITIDNKALAHIIDIGTQIVVNDPPVPAYPALVILALEEYLQRRGIQPNFRTDFK